MVALVDSARAMARMNLKVVGHVAFVGLLAVHAVGLFFLAVAASLGQSDFARDMLRVLLASAVTSTGCYVIGRPFGGLLVASLGVAAAGTMWGLGGWEDRPRPADRVEATFSDFKLIIPAGEACFPSFGGHGHAALTLRPEGGECPRLGEGTMVQITASRQPETAIGHFPIASTSQPLTSISPQQFPQLELDEGRAISALSFGDAIVLLGSGLPSPLYSCRSGHCQGAARYRSALVNVRWREEPGRRGDQTMMGVARKFESWTR